MLPPGIGAGRLASRLRELRVSRWPEWRMTQAQLATTLGVSVPTISAWENQKGIPPTDRLDAYAQLFCSDRSHAGHAFRQLDDGELTSEERQRRDDLQRELLSLRAAAEANVAAENRQPSAGQVRASPTEAGLWYFPDQRPITIVCAPLPDRVRVQMPYTDPEAPDYIEMYTYADLDALVELHGHVRAMNPWTTVAIRLASALEPDDYTSHLVLLGGVDWNSLTRELLRREDLPVSQVPRDDESDIGCFEVVENGGQRRFVPVVKQEKGKGHLSLLEDIAHVYRGPNPFNEKCTVMVCNGMFGRGVWGAVRALTDERFRSRNAEYVLDRFGGGTKFSILSRVEIVDGSALTPDWTDPETRLHEWPSAPA